LNTHRFLDKRRLWIELLFCSPVFLGIVLLNAELDAASMVFGYLEQYAAWQLGDILFSLMFILPIYLFVFALRRKREIEMLVSQAGTDALTGVLNRRRAVEILTNEVRRAHRSNAPLSLIVFDVDHFKLINDTYGHPAGDQVLKQLVASVGQHVRSYDYLARIGGEEFMLIVTETEGNGATEIAERLRLQVETSGFGLDRAVTASFGVSQLRRGESYSDLMYRTDERLYWAKNEGRNRVVGPEVNRS